MSVQFGRWEFDGTQPRREYIEKAASTLVPYGPDGQNSYCKDGVTIVYRAFHTTSESRSERQPHLCKSGAVLTWDGRLDNRAELLQQVNQTLESDCPDVLIVAAVYDQWAKESFAKLIGDWTLSIWSPGDQSLILANDPIGTRHLYYCYSCVASHVAWSSLLDPLLLAADRSFELSEEYIAGWLSFFPAAHLTPYVGICSVPPSSYVHVTRNGLTVRKYWDFDPHKKILYGTDEEYEEHFRSVFGQSVRRRLRSCAPIMAELSGGMDSSSIVCMADTIIRSGKAETPRLDTVSYYNDDEPNWNERPYFEKVEAKLGKTGCHIWADSENLLDLAGHPEDSFCAVPTGLPHASQMANDLVACLKERGSRVLLSGIGGDEVAGGVPTAVPEIADLLATIRLRELSKQLRIWALAQRRPWFHLLFETAKQFLPQSGLHLSNRVLPNSWVDRRFAKRNQHALAGYPARLKVLGSLPSFQDNLLTLDMLRRQLACASPSAYIPLENRYPFLDRNLLEFIYAVPRSQLVRPGQRRSLMRRALASIVPREILDRRRKAFVVRGPMAAIAKHSESFLAMSANMASESLGIVDSQQLTKALRDTCRGLEVPLVSIMRTLQLEIWIRSLARSGIVRNSAPSKRSVSPQETPVEFCRRM